MNKRQVVIEFDSDATQETFEAAQDTIQDALAENGFEHWYFVVPEKPAAPAELSPIVMIDASGKDHFTVECNRYADLGYKLAHFDTHYVPEPYDTWSYTAVFAMPDTLP